MWPLKNYFLPNKYLHDEISTKIVNVANFLNGQNVAKIAHGFARLIHFAVRWSDGGKSVSRSTPARGKPIVFIQSG